jgi:low temperature requirement protein LtrA
MSDVIPVPLRRRMSGRDPGEAHRTSTPLELFFDLCFVVAVATAAAQLHHGLSEGHLDDLPGYLAAFFAIWWAWMGYTWLASAYDCDDVIFRLLTFVVMAGVLVLAVGLPTLFAEGNSATAVAGYVLMRLATVGLWMRAAHDHAERRRTAMVYAAGVTVVQLLWIARLVLSQSALVWATFLLLVAAELAVPLLAERLGGSTPWHPHHIAERYSLFTIIVLGEVLLATTQAIQGFLDRDDVTGSLALVIVGGLLTVFSMWWLYFKRPYAEMLRLRTIAVWPFGYGHYLVFASVAAVGAALATIVDVVQHEAHVSSRTAGLTLAVSVAVFLVVLAGIHAWGSGTWGSLVSAVVVAGLVFAVGLLGIGPGWTVLLIGLVTVGAVAQHVLVADRAAEAA